MSGPVHPVDFGI